MPITYVTMLIASLSLAGFPFLSGFYSKDLIIEAVKHSDLATSNIAYFSVMSGVFITSLYSFRLLFLVFHTQERMDLHVRDHLNDGHWTLWLPLVILAVPSAFIGYFATTNVMDGFFTSSIHVNSEVHHSMAIVKEHFHGSYAMGMHGLSGMPFVLLVLGAITAFFVWGRSFAIAEKFKGNFRLLDKVLTNKYGFDLFNEKIIVPIARAIGWGFWRGVDRMFIDGLFIKGIPKVLVRTGGLLRQLQTGLIYHYVLFMILGMILIYYYIRYFYMM